MSWFFQQTGTILHRTSGTAVDAYGNETYGTTTTATNLELQQTRRTEPGEAGEFSITEWTGFFPSGTSIDTGDAVVVTGKGTFEVVGEPYDANQGSSAVNYLETTLKRTEGAP